MASYKVIQDIEAEDKLLGPLTFRQFIYAGACAVFLYICFLAISKGAPFLTLLFFPPAAIAGFFAWPWGGDQPTEIWALARIRFLIKPRLRIWDQGGAKDLVTITAPRKIEAVYTNGLSESEVQNRLRALADTIDSRGWAIKNVNVNMFNPMVAAMDQDGSDRLININNLPQPVPDLDIQASDDIMEDGSPVSRQLDSMIAASTKAHRDEIMEQLRRPDVPAPVAAQNTPQPANNYWFLNQPTAAVAATTPQDAVTFNTQVVAPGTPQIASAFAPANPTAEEEALIQKIAAQQAQENVNAYNHWHTIKPLSEQNQPTATPVTTPVVQPIQTAIPRSAPQQMARPTVVPQAPMRPQPVPVDQLQPRQPVWQPDPGFSAPQTATAKVTQTPDPAILRLASNDDLNVSTIAREANKRKEELQDEVVISLH